MRNDLFESIKWYLWPYLGQMVRDPEQWKPSIKTADPEKHFLLLIQYLFGKYKAPYFLGKSLYSLYVRDLRIRSIKGERGDKIDFMGCYISIIRGGSVFKEYLRPYLTKKECANFVRYGSDKLTPHQNLWFARAITAGCSYGWAHNIARTLDIRGVTDFNLSIMNFFIENPVKQDEMIELFDYMRGSHEENEHFSLKRRTLESVRVLSEEWHRLVAKRKKYSNLFWDGHPIDDWSIEEQNKGKVNWYISQIKNANLLIKEGHAMRHCVGTYANSCKSGNTSIWSLTTSSDMQPDRKRVLTLEVRDNGLDFSLVQARGHANRLATNKEMNIVGLWCKENDICSNRYY